MIVREDLVGASDAEIEQHLILDNYARRQLRPLEQARIARRLRELLHGNVFAQLDLDGTIDVYQHTRDRIGDLLGVSGRRLTG